MKNLNLRSVAILVASLCSLALGQNAYSVGGASRGPINAAGDSETASVGDGAIIDFNPTRDVVTTDAGYDSVTSIRVDTTNGVAQGYAEYSLDADRTYDSVDAAGGSIVGGALSLDTFLVGPGGAGAPDTVNVTVEMAFDGIFTVTDGSPTLLLGADLAATTIATLLPIPEGTIYQSTLSFISSAITDPGTPVGIAFGSSEAPLLGGDSMDFDGGSQEVLSATPDDLNAILRMTFPLTVGDSLLLTGTILGGAGPYPDVADTDQTDGVDVLAAAGAVDFSNTARLRITVPEGYSFDGDDPLLDNIVVTTPVPVPASIWLVAGGLVVLAGRSRFSRLPTSPAQHP